jgi:hypothetical protein
MAAIRLIVLALVLAGVSSAVQTQPAPDPPDLNALAKKVRESIRKDYVDPRLFTYIERGRDVDISRLGKISMSPMQTYEVYPKRVGESWKRLIEVDGKPLDPADLQKNDAKHARDLREEAERLRTETPRQRAERLEKDAEEIRERDQILDDAQAVFQFGFICRETFQGEPVIVVSLTPRPNARVTTREGGWMKQFTGKLWIAEDGDHIARVQLRAFAPVTIGWGFVARVEPGSGFDFVRKKIGDSWVASELTVEGSGRTLMVRGFQIKTVTTYTNHRPYTPPPLTAPKVDE